MKVLELNSFDKGSTGKICLGIFHISKSQGNEMLFVCEKWKGKDKLPFVKYLGTRITNYLSYRLGKLGFLSTPFSYFNTMSLIKFIKKEKPDLLHIHSLLNWYISPRLLFKNIKKMNIPVVWTLHDCWAFTGRCPHFSRVRCYKWLTECNKCETRHNYPQSFFDTSRRMFNIKKKSFTGVKRMIITTPSRWLAELVKESFLGEYPIKTINNGINLNVFRPTNDNVRKNYGISPSKFVLLGVAFNWSQSKGLDIFIKLASQLPSKYQIVLVGTTNEIDKLLPLNIVSIHKTANQLELAKIYSTADLFINPTREDNFPTVNIESLACGTPVITFKTGGSPEIIDSTCGSVIERDDLEALKKEIIKRCEHEPFAKNDCIKRASRYNEMQRFQEYVELYKKWSCN